MADLQKGSNVWVDLPKGKFLRWAVVDKMSQKELTVKMDNSTEVSTTIDKVKVMQNSVEGLPDMILLNDLHDGSLLLNLKVRFQKSLVYTYVGSILIALNPYKPLPIYNPQTVRSYRGVPLGQLPPHIFAIADHSYHSMLKDCKNQCILISGESGAGKTESTKIILQYLAMLSGKHSQTEERILSSSPILEAFGNACTVRNNNSSRFGKYIEILFDKNGVIQGGKLNEYLLEKSRIVYHAKKERNYHSFYNLIAGAKDSEKAQLFLTKPEDYVYLNKGDHVKVDHINDKEDFERLTAALDNFGINSNTQNCIWKVLAIILHLGNIAFEKSQNEEGSVVKNPHELENTAVLLAMLPSDLTTALCNRTNVTKGEVIVSPLNPTQASEGRDALVKALYGWLFGWIVKIVNDSIEVKDSKYSIGVLDIFGFEDFEKNSFEQLCINYANEKLQQFFNTQIFKLEQETYRHEGITVEEVKFQDNQPCLDMISKRPTGIVQILDDESNFPKATDKTFVEKVAKTNEKNSYLDKPKRADCSFSIVHYAGKVNYDCTGFLDKNRDLLRADLEKMCVDCKFGFISDIKLTAQLDDQLKKVASTKNMSGGTVSGTGSSKIRSTASKFDESLSLLISVLNNCEPHFVRCLKPNVLKKADIFEDDMVFTQLRYSGLMETVRIRKSGYPVRRKYEDFLSRYRCLMIANKIDIKDQVKACDQLLKKFDQAAGGHQLGKSQIFFKEKTESLIEKQRAEQIQNASIVIQRYTRGYLQRKVALKTSRSIKIIQRFWRIICAKRNLKHIKAAVRKIQRFYKSYRARKLLKELKRALSVVQIVLRCRLARGYIAFIYKQVETAKKIKQEAAAQAAIKAAAESQKAAANASKAAADALKAAEMKAKELEEKLKRDKEEAAAAALKALNDQNEIISNFIEVQIAFKASKEMDDLFCESFYKSAVQISEPVSVRIDSTFENPLEMANFEFSKFVKAYFAGNDENYTGNLIKRPILSTINDKYSMVASSFHQCLLYMMENVTAKSNILMLDRLFFIIKTCITESNLCDELYSQLCKQIQGNPKVESIVLGWRLMSLLLQYFPPSPVLLKFLYKFIGENAPSPLIATLKRRLIRSSFVGKRMSIPGYEELSRAGILDIDVDVTLPGDNQIIIDVDPMISCSELMVECMKQLQVTSFPGWTIFYERKGKIFYPEPFAHVLDFDPEATQETFKANIPHLFINFIMIKETLFPEEVIRDDIVVEMIVKQIKANIKDTKVAIDPDCAARYVALIKQIDKMSETTSQCTTSVLSEPEVFLKSNDFVAQVEKYQKIYAQETRTNLKKILIFTAAEVPGIFRKKYQVFCENAAVFKKNPQLLKKEVDFSVETNGLNFFEPNSTFLLHQVPYAGLKVVETDNHLELVNGGETIKLFHNTTKMSHIRESIHRFEVGLIRASKWGIALGDHGTQGDPTLLMMKQGDVIEVLEKKHDWWKGKNHSLTVPVEGFFPMGMLDLVVAKPSTVSKRPLVTEQESEDIATKLPTLTAMQVTTSTSLITSSAGSLPEEPHVAAQPGTSFLIPILEWASKNLRNDVKKKKLVTDGVKGTIRRLTGTLTENQIAPKETEMDISKIKEKLQFSILPIRASMLKTLNNEEDKIAVECFQLIMKFMGDYPVKELTPVDLASSLIEKVLDKSDDLRTEVFLQLLRQLTCNSNAHSEAKGWWLLQLLSGYFSPHASFASIFIKWLQLRSVSTGFIYKAEVANTEKNLYATMRYGPRKTPPTVEELTFQELGRPLTVQVHLMDRSSKRIHVAPCSVVGEIPQQVCKKLDIIDASQFVLYAYDGDEFEMLFPEDYVLDDINPKHLKNQVAPLKKLYLKKIVWRRNEIPRNLQMTNMMFSQMVDFYLTGYTNPSIADAGVLACILCKAAGIDVKNKDLATLEEICKAYIPPATFNLKNGTSWAKEIESLSGAFANLDVNQAKKKFLMIAQTWKLYGAAIFYVSGLKCDKVSLPEEGVLIFSPSSMIVVHPFTKTTCAEWEYNTIAGYSYSPDRVNLKLGGFMDKEQTILSSLTSLGREICFTLEIFGHLAMEEIVNQRYLNPALG